MVEEQPASQTDSVYQEYLGLIDQNPAAREEPAEPPQELQPAKTLTDVITELIAVITAFITRLLGILMPG